MNMIKKLFYLIIFVSSTNLTAMNSDNQIQELFKLENKEPKDILENYKKFLQLKKLGGTEYDYINKIICGKFTRYHQFLLNSLSDKNFKKLNRYIFIIIEKAARKEIELEQYEINTLVSLVELLIELKKFDNLLENLEGQNLLILGYVAKISNLVPLLIKSKSFDINKKMNIDGDAMIVCSSRDGNTDIVQLLIKHGANVNAKNKNRVTALMTAAQEGHKEILELLIDSGADVNEKDTNLTALECARKKNHKEVVELLKINGADFQEAQKKSACNMM